MYFRIVDAMTQGTLTLGHGHRMATRKTRHTASEERRRNPISEFMAAAIRARGGEATRDSERMFRDLQAAQGAREAGR
jgi:hypothetical protein